MTPDGELPAPGTTRFDDRVAIITGAGRGIGRAIAVLMASRGAKVVVNDLGTTLEGATTNVDVATAVVDEIVEVGGEAVASNASAATTVGAETMVRTALDAFGRIDILVNNAGIMRDGPFLEMDEAAWDDVIAVNLRAAFCCTHAAARLMADQGYGRVVNMSSISAFGQSGIASEMVGRANYSAAKAGLLGLTWSLAGELSSYGITCNAVMPTATTRLMLAARERRAAAGIETPPEGIIERDPEDAAHLVASLASEAAAQTNGRVFWIDRGRICLYDPPIPTMTLDKRGRWNLDELVAELGAVTPRT
jgi:NAD(P)-dependent dehydrogenase (short-subunit alcohol dehydrogenase family)